MSPIMNVTQALFLRCEHGPRCRYRRSIHHPRRQRARKKHPRPEPPQDRFISFASTVGRRLSLCGEFMALYSHVSTNVNRGAVLRFPETGNADAAISAAVVSKDCDVLVTAHRDHVVRVWHWPDVVTRMKSQKLCTLNAALTHGKEKRTLRGHLRTPWVLVFGTSWLVSTCLAGEIRVWNCREGVCVGAYNVIQRQHVPRDTTTPEYAQYSAPARRNTCMIDCLVVLPSDERGVESVVIFAVGRSLYWWRADRAAEHSTSQGYFAAEPQKLVELEAVCTRLAFHSPSLIVVDSHIDGELSTVVLDLAHSQSVPIPAAPSPRHSAPASASTLLLGHSQPPDEAGFSMQRPVHKRRRRLMVASALQAEVALIRRELTLDSMGVPPLLPTFSMPDASIDTSSIQAPIASSHCERVHYRDVPAYSSLTTVSPCGRLLAQVWKPPVAFGLTRPSHCIHISVTDHLSGQLVAKSLTEIDGDISAVCFSPSSRGLVLAHGDGMYYSLFLVDTARQTLLKYSTCTRGAPSPTKLSVTGNLGVLATTRDGFIYVLLS